MNKKQIDNPDRKAVEQAVSSGKRDVPMHSSPMLKALNCRIDSAQRGKVVLRFHPSDAHVQGNGVVCGGIIATMLDFALAFAALSVCGEGESAASVGLNVNFLGPVRPGSLLVEASLVSEGYRLTHAEARLTDEARKLLATAQSPLAMKRSKSG